MERIEANKSSWIRLFEEYEQRMQQGNNYMIQEIEDRKLPGSSNVT
jgi:hypothetical protein